MREVPRWTVAEVMLESARDYDNPLQDLSVTARVTGPSGFEQTVDAFWDGGRVWRIRFCPDEPGAWRWRSESSEAGDSGLHGREGTAQCVPYSGDNPLYRHGPPRVADDRRRFVHADGTPFFWLGDTAWNGPLRARDEDWRRYLRVRREQAFTAIQFVSTQWRGCTPEQATGAGGGPAYTGTERIAVVPEFFQRLDQRVAAINEHGMVAVPIILWTIWETDPGQALSESDAILLARYIVARWGAHHVAWMLAGDGQYRDERAERWQRIGRAVFADRHDRPVTMHPGGQQWVGAEFRDEFWYDFIGYQSGHGSSPEHLAWLVQGPPATDWDAEPRLPIVNLEPNYEAHLSYHINRHFTDHEVRRAAYWSLLVSPPAGVTYGHNAIWPWNEREAAPEGHPKLGPVPAWPAGLEPPGARSMTILRRFFEGLPEPWWQLRPAPDLPDEQPGDVDPERFIAAARVEGGNLAVVYLPEGGDVGIHVTPRGVHARARWFDPRGGEWTDAGTVARGLHRFVAPGAGDWLLVVSR